MVYHIVNNAAFDAKCVETCYGRKLYKVLGDMSNVDYITVTINYDSDGDVVHKLFVYDDELVHGDIYYSMKIAMRNAILESDYLEHNSFVYDHDNQYYDISMDIVNKDDFIQCYDCVFSDSRVFVAPNYEGGYIYNVLYGGDDDCSELIYMHLDLRVVTEDLKGFGDFMTDIQLWL